MVSKYIAIGMIVMIVTTVRYPLEIISLFTDTTSIFKTIVRIFLVVILYMLAWPFCLWMLVKQMYKDYHYNKREKEEAKAKEELNKLKKNYMYKNYSNHDS